MFPVDSAWGTAPGAQWTEDGYTKDGVTVRWRQQIQEYMIDQFVDPVLVLPLSRDLRFIANIGQVNMNDLTVATGQGSASGGLTAAGQTGVANYTVSANASNNYYSIYFDVRNPVQNDFARFIGWKTRGIGDIEIHVHLPDLAQLNIEMRALPDDSVNPARIAQFRMQFG